MINFYLTFQKRNENVIENVGAITTQQYRIQIEIK